MTFLIIFHAIICVMLMVIILMQTGRRGGLTEAFASTESMLGTKTNDFMVTATTTFCTLFFVTSLVLAVLSAQKGKSLMIDAKVSPKSEKTDVLNQVSGDAEAVKQEVQQVAADADQAVDQAVTDAAQAVIEVTDQSAEAVVPAAEVAVPSSEDQPVVPPVQ